MKIPLLLFAFLILFLNFSYAQIKDPVWDGFKSPPAEYGPLPFYWWTGEKLSVPRIAEQLDQMKNAGFAGVCVDYTHTVAGYQYRGDPPFFSEDWWQLWEKVVDECAQRHLTIGLDDYLITHGSPQLAAIGSRIYRDEPGISGLLLRQKSDTVKQGQAYSLQQITGTNILDAVAFQMQNKKIRPNDSVHLSAMAKTGKTTWQVPEGDWYVSILYTEHQPYGAMNPLYAQKVIEYYFENFEKHSKGLLGKTVNFFHQDELTFGGTMPYWSRELPDEFRRQKGYDLLPELSALFTDLGKRTVKVRLDYYDVATAMMEKAYFQPIYEWCNRRNVLYAHDQVSRADVISGVQLYGDYFRTMRWYSAPGTDRMPELLRGKVVSSICQLYDRPRAWLEGYHSEGWGVRPADIARWDHEAMIYGYNLMNYHSCYYTTLGGWWEWAPGDVTFRQPYFSYLTDHYTQVKRLCYLLSQGQHRCDVAILFPSSVVQGDMTGTNCGAYAEEARTLLSVADTLFKKQAIDFDFIDDESILKAQITEQGLAVAGGSYQVVLLPAVRYIRMETLDKILTFYRNGGKVIALSALPEASDHAGSQDEWLDENVREIFGLSADRAKSLAADSMRHQNGRGGIGYFVKKRAAAAKINDLISHTIVRDFTSTSPDIWVLHRRIAEREVYALYHSRADSIQARLFFRVKAGAVEEWDVKTGAAIPVELAGSSEQGVELELDFLPNEFKIMVFSNTPVNKKQVKRVLPNICTAAIVLDDRWEIEYEPLLNNRWGDFRSPAADDLLGLETKRFRYHVEQDETKAARWNAPDLNDSTWSFVTSSYGPRLWLLGPFKSGVRLTELEKTLIAATSVTPSVPVQLADQSFAWIPQESSLRWGMLNDPVLVNQTGYAIHGAIGYVPKEIIHVQAKADSEIWYAWTSIPADRENNSKLAVGSRAAYNVWLNGQELLHQSIAKPEIHVDPWWLSYYPYAVQVAPVLLHEGNNRILLKLRTAQANSYARIFLAVDNSHSSTPEPAIYEEPTGNADFVPNGFVGLESYIKKHSNAFDCFAQNRPRALWYRFKTPPGMKSMAVTGHGKIRVWIDGKEMQVVRDNTRASIAARYEQAVNYVIATGQPLQNSAQAAIRLEPQAGYYGGAALPEPVQYAYGAGQANLGDWSAMGLESYSGAIRYKKQVVIDREKQKQIALLRLGDVNAAAKIYINGRYAGACYAWPWQIEITDYLQTGKNIIEISVANTLANHYSVGMPCGLRYVRTGQTRSGLFGPVRLEFWTR
jgi:hypothetical protein